VPADAVALVNAKKQEFIAGTSQVFAGPLKDNRGMERVKAGAAFPLTDLGKMDWLVEGVIGQSR
jgi:basic membrane protein A and related proteins